MQLFANIRDLSDGLKIFNLNINYDRYVSDHTPSFQIELTILNLYNNIQIYQNNYEEEQ